MAERKSTPKKPAAKKPAAKKPVAAKAKPRVTPKPDQRRSKRTSAARTSTEAARDVALFDNISGLGDLLAEHLVLTKERLQETLDDAVRRGRMLPDDAADIALRLSIAGRKQVEDLLSEADRRLRSRK